MTACMWASVRGHTDVVQLFLSSGTQADLQDEVSTTSIPILEPHFNIWLAVILGEVSLEF